MLYFIFVHLYSYFSQYFLHISKDVQIFFPLSLSMNKVFTRLFKDISFEIVVK